jgi:hypothetical protein
MVARPVASLILSLAAVGCATVRPVPNPEQFIATSAPDVVYVTHVNGAVLTITHPRVSGDSLLGDWAGAAQGIDRLSDDTPSGRRFSVMWLGPELPRLRPNRHSGPVATATLKLVREMMMRSAAPIPPAKWRSA